MHNRKLWLCKYLVVIFRRRIAMRLRINRNDRSRGCGSVLCYVLPGTRCHVPGIII